MGVRGLTTFVNCNQDKFLKSCLLHDTTLIIDGHGLCAQLYKTSKCFSAFGGDYDKFAAHVKKYFKNLKKCNISCYVLFDGGYETRKLNTAYSRFRSKIYGAARLDPVTQNNLQIFPLLFRDVFREVLDDMNIPHTVCELEADDEIAAMARSLNCPVLSYDSDFYIYNVQYIPFNMLNPNPFLKDQETRCYALECKMYKVEYLLCHFGGLKQELLPLLATLLGNDYVQKKVFANFFSHLKLPKSKTKKNDQQRSIQALFTWLQKESLETAISKIIGRLKKQDKQKIYDIIQSSVQGYNRMQCKSLVYFGFEDQAKIECINSIELDLDLNSDDNAHDSDDDSSTSSDHCLNDYEEIVLPDWLVQGIRDGTIAKPLINIYIHNLYFSSPQAEDYNDEDASICSLPILKYAFDILTDFSRENFVYVSREKDSNYKRIEMGKEYSIPKPSLPNYCDMNTEQKHELFTYFMKTNIPRLDINTVGILPSNLKLVYLSLIWWSLKCKVPESHIYSILMCHLMLEVIDEKTGTFRGSYFFNNKYSTKIKELKNRPKESSEINEDNLFLNKNKVAYDDCLLAAAVLLEHFELNNTIRKKPKSYDIRIIHGLAQFQCCLMQINAINDLCGKPYPSTKYYSLFNGTFVYNMIVKLHNVFNTVEFIEKYVCGANTIVKYFKSLHLVYLKCTTSIGIANASSTKSTKKRRYRKKKQTLDEDIDLLINNFEVAL